MKIKRGIAFLIIVFCAVFTAVFGRFAIKENGIDVTPPTYRGVIKLWQIDSFEGGTGSRKQFLLSAAAEYEKTADGVLVMVISHTQESAKTAISQGNVPDLISYGAGTYLPPLAGIDVQNYIVAGAVADKVYATPWCRGGYCLIENPAFSENKKKKQFKFTVSESGNSLPLVAAAVSGTEISDFNIKTSLNAYTDFVAGKSKYLLGTQRDINRLLNRGMDFICTPITVYNDLYQYISLTDNDKEKTEYAQGFIDYLMTEKVQKNLYKIGMYSCFYPVEYDNVSMRDMQNARFKYTVPAFSSAELLEELKDLSHKVFNGEEDAFIKIQKLLTLS